MAIAAATVRVVVVEAEAVAVQGVESTPIR